MTLTLAMTGATGFVGGHALAAAAARGHRVAALARRPQPERDGVRWVAGSLADPPALARLVEGADAVVHIAGVTNARNRAGFETGNVAGTVELRRAAGPLPFLHLSSLAAREPGLSLYGATKRQGEDVARGCAGPVAILRPPAVYGPGDREFLALFKAVRAGLVPLPAGARAAMIFAADLGEAIVALAEDLAGPARAAGGLFEIDDGAGAHAQPAIAAAIAAALGVRARTIPVPGTALRLAAAFDTASARFRRDLPTLSFDRARYLAHPDWGADSGPLRALGIWQPRTALPEGMARTAAWYRHEGLL
jgi:nucleoside-diphosphate-sugar epimerase